MKKLMMAAAVMIVAASAARAAGTEIDFDGRFKPQTLHDIFMESRQLIPPATPVPAKAGIAPIGSACALVCAGQQLTSDCKCEPYYTWPDDNCSIDWNSISQYIQSGNNTYCMPVASGPAWLGCVAGAAPVAPTIAPEIPTRSFGEMSIPQKKLLAAQYILQSSLKKTVLARSAKYGFSPEMEAFISEAKTKILYDNKKVYITNGKMLIVITDETLITATKNLQAAILQHMGGTKELGTMLAGAGILIGCMSNSSCWGDVGDAVSDLTEWYVTHVQDHTGDPLLNTPD